jgi:hypothetical protein
MSAGRLHCRGGGYEEFDTIRLIAYGIIPLACRDHATRELIAYVKAMLDAWVVAKSQPRLRSRSRLMRDKCQICALLNHGVTRF